MRENAFLKVQMRVMLKNEVKDFSFASKILRMSDILKVKNLVLRWTLWKFSFIEVNIYMWMNKTYLMCFLKPTLIYKYFTSEWNSAKVNIVTSDSNLKWILKNNKIIVAYDSYIYIFVKAFVIFLCYVINKPIL